MVADFEERLGKLLKDQLAADGEREQLQSNLTALRQQEKTATGEQLKSIQSDIRLLRKEIYRLEIKSSGLSDRFKVFQTARDNSRVYIEQKLEEKREFLRKNSARFKKAFDEFKDEVKDGTQSFADAKAGLGERFVSAMFAEDGTRLTQDGRLVPESKSDKLNRELWKQISVGSLGTREKYALFYHLSSETLSSEDAIEFQLRLTDAVEKEVKAEALKEGENPDFNYLTKSEALWSDKDKADKKAAEDAPKTRPKLRFGGGEGGFLEAIRKRAEKQEKGVEKEARAVGKLAKKEAGQAKEETKKVKRTVVKKSSKFLKLAGSLQGKLVERADTGLKKEVKDLGEIQRRFQASREQAARANTEFSGADNPLQAQLRQKLAERGKK